MVKSIGKISSVSLSMTDTGTPEFVNRICIPWLVRGKGGKQRCTLQGASGVSGLTSLPAGSGKLDNASPSAILNLSMSKISGIIWAVGTCWTKPGFSAVSGHISWEWQLTTAGNRRLVEDSSWYSLWLRTVGSLGSTR